MHRVPRRPTSMRGGFGQSRMLDRTPAHVQAAHDEAGAALRLFHKELGFAAAVGERAALRLQYPPRAREP